MLGNKGVTAQYVTGFSSTGTIQAMGKSGVSIRRFRIYHAAVMVNGCVEQRFSGGEVGGVCDTFISMNSAACPLSILTPLILSVTQRLGAIVIPY